MNTLESLKHAVNSYLDKKCITHYCHGVFDFNDHFPCLLFVLNDRVKREEICTLMEHPDIIHINHLVSNDYNITYLHVCFSFTLNK